MFTFLVCVFIWWASHVETCTVVLWEGRGLLHLSPSACAGVAVASSCKILICVPIC